MRLTVWQKLVLANLFGFVERGKTTRRFRQAVIFAPFGSGKTTLAVPIALYLTFVEGEGGQGLCRSGDARSCSDPVRCRAADGPQDRRLPAKGFSVGVGASALCQEATASKFALVSSNAKALDGLNVQVAVCDEIASHKTSGVYDVLLTAMGKRRHPLLLSISTAMGNTMGIGKQLRDYGVRVPEYAQQEERLFKLLYAADPEGDPWGEATWIKANPSWGQAVQPGAIRAIMRHARNNLAQKAATRTRHLDIWSGADEALFSMRAWQAYRSPHLRLEDFEGQVCHLGLGLASRTGLAALALVFPRTCCETGKTTYAVFARCYLNEEAVLEARNAAYPGWAAERLVLTPDSETDFPAIEDDILELSRRFQMVNVGYDPWQSTQLAQRLRVQEIGTVEFCSTTATSRRQPSSSTMSCVRAAFSMTVIRC